MSARLRKSPNVVFAVALVFGGGACGGGIEPDDLPDVDGSWTYSETTTLDQGRVTCNTLGTLSLVQDFETFVGSFIRTTSCSGQLSRPSTRSESGSIPRGRVGKSSIEFRISECDYRGVITGARPTRLTGTTLCTTVSQGVASAAGSAGSWLAERLTDSAP